MECFLLRCVKSAVDAKETLSPLMSSMQALMALGYSQHEKAIIAIANTMADTNLTLLSRDAVLEEIRSELASFVAESQHPCATLIDAHLQFVDCLPHEDMPGLNPPLSDEVVEQLSCAKAVELVNEYCLIRDLLPECPKNSFVDIFTTPGADISNREMLLLPATDKYVDKETPVLVEVFDRPPGSYVLRTIHAHEDDTVPMLCKHFSCSSDKLFELNDALCQKGLRKKGCRLKSGTVVHVADYRRRAPTPE